MSYGKILLLARQHRKSPTLAEAFFWEKVKNRKLSGKKFLRQYIIQHTESQTKKGFFIADFYCHEKKLVVEIDGSIHLQQLDYDKLREEILQEMGYTIIRFKNEDVLKEWQKVEKQVSEYLK